MSTVGKAAGAALMLLGLSAPALGADNLLTLLLGGQARLRRPIQFEQLVLRIDDELPARVALEIFEQVPGAFGFEKGRNVQAASHRERP